MTLRQRFYILIGLVLMWFVFGTILLIRSNKDFEDLKVYEGQVKAIETAVTEIPVVGKPKDILHFTIIGLDKKLGIYHNTKADYDFYLNKITPGDKIKVYFEEFGGETMEGFNLHVFQLEKDGEILLDKEGRNKTDRKVGLILYGVGLLFSIGPIWFFRKKMRA
ncbi:MAG TPA: hypothetical protein VGD40_23450 [Chryseosolibacter sp.]